MGRLRIVEVVARHPMMRTPDGRWSVEVITGRTGRQSFRVKRLDRLPAPGSSGLPAPGVLVRTIGEVRELLGDDFDRLVEVRDRRFDGGR